MLKNNFRTLGKSGLVVSPLALGTLTFGTEWGYGVDKSISAKIFNSYVDAGGNFIDSADGYTGGTSEEMVGDFVMDRKLRDQLVIATKYTFNAIPGNPNAGGNGRKNMMRALEGSLRRLKTDYIDLYWAHTWDTYTPVEEVIYSLNSLVQSGKVRYIGLSDCPAWYVSRAQTIAEMHAMAKVSAIQMEYNLIERSIEREYTDLCTELGIGINVWSPLASGFLSGKHSKEKLQGRLEITKDSPNPVFERITKSEKNWEIMSVLNAVSKELGKHPAQVALNWVTNKTAVSSTIIGATKLEQLELNLSALDFTIPAELLKKLDAVSALAPATPYMFFEDNIKKMVTGGTHVTAF